MGTSICQRYNPNSERDIAIIAIKGPPNIIKPTPIISIKIEDDDVIKEESPTLQQKEDTKENKVDPEEYKIEPIESKMVYTAQQSEEIDQNQSKAWIKKTFSPLVVTNIKHEENVSFDPNTSGFDVQYPKSILKISKNPQHSQEHSFNDQNSVESIKSQKKVTFDKQVIYSNFRKR